MTEWGRISPQSKARQEPGLPSAVEAFAEEAQKPLHPVALQMAQEPQDTPGSTPFHSAHIWSARDLLPNLFSSPPRQCPTSPGAVCDENERFCSTQSTVKALLLLSWCTEVVDARRNTAAVWVAPAMLIKVTSTHLSHPSLPKSREKAETTGLLGFLEHLTFSPTKSKLLEEPETIQPS